ncbi:exonuclease [Phytobacter ursingii]|uniref:3'-5' exoribonuclease n=1 Tax=Phytobacter ursingii TaxID=1972431 RepID=A0AB35RVX1_9ENTR|nr:3'-5' exoribonuclease [Phytobacter ursingii]MDV2865002.1 3'-5' exoribonuclease [Phytobacter ursingii]
MQTYAFLIKAKAKATDAKHLFCWLSAKSDSRAEREIANILEDADIETGRGAPYLQPVRTDWFVVDDLPEEGVLDATWCDRYELNEDGRSWKQIPTSAPTPEPEVATTAPGAQNDVADTMEHPAAQLGFRQQFLAAYICDEFAHHVTADQRIMISDLMLDVDNHYVQNLMLAAENVAEAKKYSWQEIWKLTDAVKKVFAPSARHELGVVLRFMQAWAATHHIDRGLLVKEWLAGKRVAAIQHTDANTNAGGGIPTDRNPDYIHTLDTLDIEIAAATLPMDFDIYNIPVGIHRRAKEIISGKESPWKEWSAVLRKTPGILDYSRAAIFAAIRTAANNLHESSAQLQAWVSANLTETNHAKPSFETLAAARQLDSAAMVAGVIQGTEPVENPDKLSTEFAVVSKQVAEAAGKPAADSKTTTEVANLGNGVFSIDNLMSEHPASTTTQQNKAANNVPMEEVVSDETQTGNAVPSGEATTVSVESGAATGSQTTTVDDDIDTGHHIPGVVVDSLMTHLMVDLETMGNNPEAPIVAIGAMFFDPLTGNTGEEFYQIVSLESAMDFGAKPDAATIIWWMKQSAEARAAITGGDAISLMDAIDKFDEFVHDNSTNGIKSVQLWGNGSSFDNVILRRAYEQVGAELCIPFWNDRDVRTIVELGKTIGMNPRYEIPFEGDMHNASDDARHQVKYVSAIWQRLTAN